MCLRLAQGGRLPGTCSASVALCAPLLSGAKVTHWRRPNAPALALDEHRVSDYRTGADFALMVGGGADLPTVIDGAAYVHNPRLAALLPELSVLPSQFNPDELAAIAITADEDATVRGLLAKRLARHCLRADVLFCLGNHYDRRPRGFLGRPARSSRGPAMTV
jgi:hypothetical protein